MANPKRTYSTVYNALQQISDEEGIDFGLGGYTEQQFKDKYFTGPGNINNLYNKLSQISDEEGVDFGLGTRSEWLGSFGFTEEDAMPNQGYKPTAEDMAGFNSTIRNAGRTAGSSLGSFDSKVQNIRKRQGLNVPSRIEVGKSNNLTQGRQQLNPETGQLENTYITSSGNEYNNEALADMEQRQIDKSVRDERYKQSLPGQLDDAYAERDRLNAELAKLQGQWVDQDGRVHYGNRGNDEAAASLEAALRQNQQRITALEAERDDDGGTQFWRGFIDAAQNPSTLTFGMSDFGDMVQLMRIKNKMDAAVESGQQPQLSDAEQSLLENSYLNNYAQQQYGENRGFMYRAGGISMQALPFVAEFMATGGMGAISQKGAELGTRAAEKLALQGLSRSLVKNLGVLAGDVAAGWAMANTTGIFRTAGDVMQRNMGGVTINPEGQYDFGEYDDEGNYHRGGKSLGRSIYEAEVANTLEYYTEKLGEHLQIGKWLAKGADKMGLSKLSKVVNYLSGNKWLERGGIQDYPSEVVEEEANLLLNGLLVGDNNLSINPNSKDFDKSAFNPKTQLDIWGGMLFSIGLMQAPRLAYTGYSSAGYYAYKKNVDMADGEASIVFGADNWQMIKDEIDNCENDRLSDLMQTVINGDMTDVQKTATLNYAKNLIKMRGYNMGMMAGAKDEEEATSNEGMAAQAVNQSYQQGHETQEPDLMKQFNNDVLVAQQNLSQYGEEFVKEITDASDTPVQELDYLMSSRNYFTDEQIAAAADYYTKQARAKGMMEGALDRIDIFVENANAEVRVNTHQQTGNVVVAKGNDNIDYYIIGGDIVTDPETDLTSLNGTGGAVVVRDQLGNVSVKSPQDLTIYSMQPADELININETDLRQRLMKQADDDITFGSPANEVYQLEDVVTLQDADGNTITGEIGMMPNASDGVYVVYTSDGKALQYTADELNRMIVAHNGMEVQRGATMSPQSDQVSDQVDENSLGKGAEGVGSTPEASEAVNIDVSDGEGGGTDVPPSQTEEPQSALSRIPVATDEKGQPVTDKKGRPQYQWHKASVEDAAAALIETTGGDMVMARDTANDLVNVAKGKLEKIRKQKPKGEDPIEIAESRQEIKRAENEVQATIRQWQDVALNIGKQINAESERLRQEAEARKSEEQKAREAEEKRQREEKQREMDRQKLREAIERDREKRNKEYQPLVDARKEMADDADAMAILNDTEPRSIEEWVSSMIRPHSMLWQDSSDSEIGLQSELGLKRGDMQRMMSLLGTKESGAKPFGKVVLDIYEGLPEGIKNQYTDEDVRNTLLDLFNEGSSTRMMHLTEENRIEEARQTMLDNLRRDAEAEMEAWAEAYHLTPEERETFEDFMSQAPEIPNNPEFINQIIELNYTDEEQNNRGQEVDLDNTSGTAGTESEGGEEQVQGQGSAETAGADQEKPEPEQGAETPSGGQAVPDNNVPGGTPGVEDPLKEAILAARNGDKEAQKKLEKYGLSWEKKPVVRFVSQGEVDSIMAGNRYQGKFGNGRVDVTNQKDVTTAASADYRITFKDNLDWALSDRLQMKNEQLGDGWLTGGYDLNDVATIEKRNPDGTYSVIYDASQKQNKPKRPGLDTPEGEILVKGGTILKNNLAGGDAVALVLGSNIDKKTGKRRYTVEYYSDEQAAKERTVAIGDAEIGQDEMRQHLTNGDFSSLKEWHKKEETKKKSEKKEEKKRKPKESDYAKPNPKTPWWSDSNRPKSIDPSDYKTYMTDEAKEYFANYVSLPDENGKITDFTKWAHPNLAYITAAVWDEVEIPYEDLKNVPEIAEAENTIKTAEAKGKLEISEEEANNLAQRLIDSGEARQEQKAFVIIGLPAGGKSSVFANPLSKQYGARIIDSDDVKPWLEGFDGGNGAGYVQDASAEVAEKAIDIAVKNGDNIIIPRIGGKSVMDLSAALRLAGYDVQLYFNDVKGVTSIDRAASRFAQTGRYLSLDYLTKKAGVPSENFSKFAEKTIGGYLDERSKTEVQDIRRRVQGLRGELYGSGSGLWESPAAKREGAGENEGTAQAGLGSRGLQTGSNGVSILLNSPLFNYSEWKSNDVPIGQKPKEIWNSKSGQPMPTKEVKNNETESKVSAESGAAGEGTGQTSGSADRTGAERGPESNRPERSGSRHSVNHKRIVSDSRMEELKKRLKSKLGGQLNVGVDPEILAIGAEMAVGYLERGVTKFADFARTMIDEVGDFMRPYLKSFYNAVRDMPEAKEYAGEMDDYQTVSSFDVNNFDKQAKVTDALTKAQQIVDEQKVRKDVADITDGLDMKETTINDIKNETDEQTAADTAAIVSEAEALAGEARSAKSREGRTATIEKIDKQLEKIDDQLAFIGFYDVDPDAPYHESMGRMKSAEKKAVADATRVAKRIAKDLGIDAKPTVKANMAPIGGDITFRIPINENTDLYFDLLMERGYESYPDSLNMDVSYFRLEDKNNKPQDNGRYQNYTNHHFGVLIPYDELLSDVRQAIKQAGIELAEPKAQEPKKNASKKNKQQARNQEPSLFDMMFFEDEQPDNTLGATSSPEKIEEEESKVDTNPTEAQKEAGNYQKGHIQVDGYDITIENPKGSIRRGVDSNGKAWEQVMNNTYGYIRGTEATDGDHIDVFLSDNPTEGKVFVVDQVKPDGSFDEVKVLYGFKDIAVATKAYLSNYSNGWKGLGNITGVSREAFKEWVESSHRKTKPFREYALAKRELAKDNTIANIDDVFTDNLYVDSQGNEGAINKIVDIDERGDTRWYVYQLYQNEEDFKNGRIFTFAEIREQDLQAALDTNEWRRKKENARPQRQLPKHNNKRNNVGERGQDYAPTSPKARFNANVEAIKLMRLLNDEGIDAPTKDQMEVLRKYSGWGGLGTFFNDDTMAENKMLRELLSEEEYNDAVMSINSAYYTPATVIDTLWDVAKALGFKGGNVLEGSAGIGNIIGQMPREMSSRSDIEAVEIDTISGNILRLLYPDAKVHIDGFQDVRIPNGTVDLAVTNVPFVTGLHVIDKVDKDLSRKFTNIHDFCIAKNIRKLREGGIGIFITSAGTMDKSTKLREWIPDEGQSDVIGAFRLNNETFGGTNVTSDIIVVRKRVGGIKSEDAIDISKASPMRVGSYEDKLRNEHQVSMTVNDYFREHPEMMAGEMAFGYEKGDTFRPGSYGLYPVEGMSQEKMMQDFVNQMKKVGVNTQVSQNVGQATPKPEPNQLTAEKEGRMLIDNNGRLCVSRYGTAVPLGLNDQKVKGHTKQECFKDYQDVQKAVDDVLQQQLNDPDDAALKPKLDTLNKAYDKFTKRYGTLHKNTSISFLRNDIDFPSFQALENYSETKDMKGKVKIETRKAPLFTQRVLGFKTEPKPENIKDAVTASLFRTNTIDLDWIADKLDKSVDDVRKDILDSRLGFEDPSTGQMEIRYKYLSGNVREKLAIAEGYNIDGKYTANVEELRKAVPMDIPSHLIEFSLGSSWIPIELYKDYIKETLDLSNIKLTHVEGAWIFDEGYSYHNEKNRSAGVYSEQFRETIYGHQLVAAALNNRPVKVSKQVTVGYGDSKHTETRVDQNATSACAVRVDEIKDDFKQWAKKKMQDNPELAQQIEKIYNDKFNALVPMQIDDEFLPEHFEGSNVNISLYDHQKRGVMRGLTAPTMLAHEVGTGKSFTLISTAMEMRRLGTAKKPMIVVQNATVAQITSDAKLLYPNAKVLSLTEKDRNAEGRRAFYASIKYNDWDMVIIPQSTLNMIPDSPERELQFIQEKIDEKKHVIEAAEAAGADSRQLQQMKKELEKLEQEYGDTFLDKDPSNSTKKKKKDAKKEATALDKAETRAKEMLDRNVDDVQYFDDLGVDALLVDEAHEYKHLGFQTSIGRGIKGIDPSYSKKCAGLYNKTRAVFEKAGWKNVVFATGTPISNTAAEIWTFMKYLMQPDVMKANDIYYFDDFVHNFGAISQMLEFATSGKFKENTRFAAYVNKPELIRIWSQVADTVLTKEVGEVKQKVPKKEGDKDQDVFLPQSPSLVSIMAAVRAELERFENMTGKEKREHSSIPLTMYGIAKRAAIDPRLVNPDAADEPMSKTNAAVKEIVKDLKATDKYKGTVAVFCDNQNRKGADGSIDFNIYDDMREKLIKAGVPAEQIAIIKSGMSITAKQKVFDAVNTGAIRVVLGSTQTLGTGVNMQERLHLLIHMDAPDRPMDYTQRNGRIERQGNLHKTWDKPIRILRFGVEDSLDVTAYQRLKTKSGFIDSIMDGKGALLNNQVDRTVEEEEEGLFDNPVAVLSGSQYALKKNQAERELRKYIGKKAQWEADQVYVANTLRRNKSEIADSRKMIGEYEAELERYKKMFPDGKVKVITVEGESIDLSKGDAEDYVKMVKTFKEKIQDPVNATVKKLRENPIYNDETLSYTVELDGHPINFKIDVYRTSEYENGKMKTVLHKRTHYNSADLHLTSDVTDMSKSARECVEDIMQEYVSGNFFKDRIDTFNNKINRLNEESEQLQQRVGMEFQYGKELEEAKKHVEEYTELMKKEMEEKEAKYAAQQKEAQENGGGFDLSKAEDSEDDDNLYRIDDDMSWEDDEENPIFYSNAMQAVDAIKQDKAAPQQWLAMIVKNGGLKAGEDRWLGLSDWLNNSDKKSITKQEVKNFIRMNQIYVDETYYTEGYKILDEIERRYPGYNKAFTLEQDDFDGTANYSISNLQTAVELYNKHHTPKYKITIDKNGSITDDQYDDIISFASEVFDDVSGTYVANAIDPTRLEYTTKGLENKHEIALTVPTIEPWGQSDTLHFGDAGGGRVVAWVRFGETTADDNRVLVIDEIQSKRHEEGRKLGYKDDSLKGKADEALKELVAYRHSLYDKYPGLGDMAYLKEYATPEEIAKEKELNRKHLDLERQERNQKMAPADAPFEKNWHELAMKRMLRYAAENGYDKIAWTTGGQQAERYNIGTVIDEIGCTQKWEDGKIRYDLYPKNNDGSISLFVRDGKVINSAEESLIGKDLNEVVGKSLAEKMQQMQPDETLTGDELLVGGEGMKGFYDNILPRFMNKYARKWGVSVRKIELPNVEEAGHIMWSVDITPQMKESVMLGQPMFRDREQFSEGETFPIYKGEYHSSYNVLDNRTTYSTDLMPDTYLTEQALLDALRNQYPEYVVTIEDGNVKMQTYESVIADAVLAQTAKKAKGTKSYVERKTRRAIDAVMDMAKRMNLDVEVLTTTDGLKGKEVRAKGFFNPKTHKITIVLPNNKTQSDVINTMLHEGVAHYGLRKMFGDNFNIFLDNVYNNVDPQIKARIDAAMKRNSWDRHTATEEYLARLAERTDFEHATNSGWWQKIKDFFLGMLAKAGFNTILTDNELRYILWRSYDNLLHPNDRRNIFDTARDIDMQSRLKVGQYEEQIPLRPSAAAEPLLTRDLEDDEVSQIIDEAKANGTYMKAPNGHPTNLSEEQWAMVRTKAFKEWFGDWINDPENASKVIDENGEPAVMYHGTDLTKNNRSEPFWIFRPDSHFGTEGQAKDRVHDVTEIYTGTITVAHTKAFVKIYPVFLNIRNPQRRRDADQDYLEEKDMTMSEFWEQSVERAKGRDYDGIVYLNEYEDTDHPADSWIAFNPNQIKSATDNSGAFSPESDDIRYSLRTKEPPKKTGIGYKVFVLKDGQLYPPMVANPNGEGTHVGVWLDADAAPIAGTSKTGRPQVKAGGKGTQGGSGQLAYRPGWHLGTIPYALQFNRKDASGERTLFPNNFVWAEVEYADDVDYQDEARKEGMNANGKYQHSLAGLKHVPTDGSYKYRTNPDPRTDEWVITGAMRVNKILSREEVDDIVRKAGREPQPMQEGDVLTKESIDALNSEIQTMKEADEMGLLYRDNDDWDDIAKQMYEKTVAQDSTKWTENWQDSMVSLKAIQDAIAAETGNVATGAEDAYHFENRMHGRAKNMTEQYDWRFYRPMLKAFNDFCKQNGMTHEQGMDYLIAKSGLERNIYYAFRDAAKAKIIDDINEERDDLEKLYAKGRIDEDGYKAKKAELEEREQNGVDDFMNDVRSKFAYKHAKQELENGNISYGEYLRIIEKVIRAEVMRKTPKRDEDGNIVSDNYYDENVKDWSGLTETFAKEMYDAAQNVKKQAQKAIDPKERKALWAEYDEQMRNAYITAREVAEDQVFAAENDGESRIKADKLWNKINDATKETLRHSYESGLIDRNNYYKVRAMFDYYIPLRGWEEDKAADVYTYMGRDNVFSPAVKKVWGRTSQAENPLAYIGNIAVSTILSGHRNQMKQHFLNYVMNNPTSLVNISESWYENIGTEDDKPVWILRTADTAGKSADEIAQIVNDFNEEMRLKQQEGKAMPVRGRLRLDVHATQGQKAEHVVEVQRAGHTYQLYINGNPKAAQALNGTAAKAVSRISDTWLGNKITNVNRNMAAFFTSKNPAFVMSNLSRDLNMAGASVAIKEGKAYNEQFIENVVKVLRPRIGRASKYGFGNIATKLAGYGGRKPVGWTGLMPSLMRKWMAGELNLNDETERLFGEFMDEGGETGFVNMLSVDTFKQKMQKEISQMNGSKLFGAKANVKETTIGKGLRLLGETFEFYNRCAEDATRFVVYMTSRQMGKTLEESIADAKDVTLNFNRKGTGGMGNAEVRDLFIFVNPAIQALANMYKMATGKPLKFGAVTAAFIAGGALMAALNAWMLNLLGDDDDKDAYWNLPPWVRKNNLVFWIPGTKNFVTIPLAQEFRVFYGVGEMVTSAVMEHPVDRWGLEIFSSVADLVPINPTGNGGNLMVDFAPTMVQPLMQVGENIDFTGRPIWKENQGNKFAPMYSKAYITTPTWMVKVSEGINDITGGNEGKKGAIEEYAPFWADYVNNPAVWNHLLQGYFGGMYNTIAKTFDVAVTVGTGNVPKIYQTPVINRFLNRPVERDNAGVLGDDYYRLTQDRDALQYELRIWQKKAADGEEGAQEHVDEILSSEDWKRAEVITHYEKIMKDLKAGEKASSQDIDKQEIKESISLYKQEMMEELAAIDEGADPLTVARRKFDEAETFSEKNKLRLRIERLQGKSGRDQKNSEDAIRKALSYREDEERESRDVNEAYLKLATSQNIADDARIKAAKLEIAKHVKEYKQMIADGRTDRANKYKQKNQKWFKIDDIISKQSRNMSANKKLLGKGHDAAIMRLIDSNRERMLKAIDSIE